MSQIDSETIPENLKRLQKAMESESVDELKELLETEKGILEPIHCSVGYYGDTIMRGLQRGHDNVVINPICFPEKLGTGHYNKQPKWTLSLPQEAIMQILERKTPVWLAKENATEIPHYLEKIKLMIEHEADLTTPSNVGYVYQADYAERQWLGGTAMSPIGWFREFSDPEVVDLLQNAIEGRGGCRSRLKQGEASGAFSPKPKRNEK